MSAGLLASVGTGTADASAEDDANTGTSEVGEPMVARVHDARTGEVELFVGTRHVRFTDHQLAARLVRASKQAR